MSARGRTVGGALRATIVEAGLVGGRVFRDRAPEGATLPYITFTDPISLVPGLVGDGRTLVRSRTLQFDLWQRTRDESDALLGQLENTVDGATLDLGGPKAWATRLTSTSRLPDPDGLVVHHALTVTVQHDRSAI